MSLTSAKEGLEVRFKLSVNDYKYMEGLAKFYYDHNILRTPSVHSLAKFSIYKAVNEWINQQQLGLQAKKQREQTIEEVLTPNPTGRPRGDHVGAPVKPKPVIPVRPVQPTGQTLEEQYNELYSSQLPEEEQPADEEEELF